MSEFGEHRLDEKDERNPFSHLSSPGMQGCPDIATVHQYLGKDHTERFSESLTFGQHNKGTRKPRAFAIMLGD
ncbi:MAG: hypothetical protein LBE44_00610 [Microbacterium hominis]|nr:hypothetical protein [Microbacterium hominis]